MSGPLSRIVVRYIAGWLVLKGILPEDVAATISSDEDIVTIVGVGLMGAVEGYYFLAHRFGWSK